MPATATLKRRFVTAIAAASCLFAGLPAHVSWAQATPGLTIFSGIPREDLLNDYHLDFEGRSGFNRERFKLRIPGNRVYAGVADIYITYPKYFKENQGKFDLEKVEVRLKNDRDRTFPIRSVSEIDWSEQNYQIAISLEQPIPAAELEGGQKIEVVFSGVRNPDRPGFFYFSCEVQAPTEVVRRYIGTWVIGIDDSSGGE
ncbi:protein of unknown function (DUF2808) [Rubidibacter lacunae KORDI 51-2]|uniref:DUF2808 domain-containing protein n=1 Tax=Rubidibacter lacunae KORDI 51-2 TaxID=582515 RepID=U5DL23_9CHRO|nr:DUF2808 domain-containing protein [Rubidibacter lacunae]ERN42386.1 protein of unknown function (DUF2808) [Rubidibacter lacunae KORDI 51-2]